MPVTLISLFLQIILPTVLLCKDVMGAGGRGELSLGFPLGISSFTLNIGVGKWKRDGMDRMDGPLPPERRTGWMDQGNVCFSVAPILKPVKSLLHVWYLTFFTLNVGVGKWRCEKSMNVNDSRFSEKWPLPTQEGQDGWPLPPEGRTGWMDQGNVCFSIAPILKPVKSLLHVWYQTFFTLNVGVGKWKCAKVHECEWQLIFQKMTPPHTGRTGWTGWMDPSPQKEGQDGWTKVMFVSVLLPF